MSDFRRNDYDVTNTVQVSSTAAVTASGGRTVRCVRGRASPFDLAATAFQEFDKLFTGRMPGITASTPSITTFSTRST